MWHNYLVVALRGLWRGRLYSLVTICGLAVGFAACLLILSYVRQELSYDRWIKSHERLYLVETTFALAPGNSFKISAAPHPAAGALVAGIPEVEAAATRARTLVPVLVGTTRLAIALTAALLVLSETGLNIAPLLAGAGIAGVALGFGAQSPVRDFLTGVFLIRDDQARLKRRLDAAGIGMPFPQRTLSLAPDRDGRPPAIRVIADAPDDREA